MDTKLKPNEAETQTPGNVKEKFYKVATGL